MSPLPLRTKHDKIQEDATPETNHTCVTCKKKSNKKGDLDKLREKSNMQTKMEHRKTLQTTMQNGRMRAKSPKRKTAR